MYMCAKKNSGNEQNGQLECMRYHQAAIEALTQEADVLYQTPPLPAIANGTKSACKSTS